MNKILSFLLILLFSVPVICQKIPNVLKHSEFGESEIDLSDFPDADAPDMTRRFPARGGAAVDWGLALSGGGIRSGYYSIGVMKALFDDGFMDKIDVISSVSGGGYASYWLFTNYKQEPQTNAKFGETAFGNEYFIRNIRELKKPQRAGFVPTASLLKIILGKRSNGFKLYKTAIEKSFGNGFPAHTPLNFLKDEITKGNAPYFIINTTLRAKGDDERNPSLRLFEITPDYRGNPALEFKDWTNDQPLTLSESIAASAAPKWKIAHPIENYAKGKINKKKLYLSDGGHSENLAALALIRRGVKNIVIVDAEEDATYQFEGYTILQKLLTDEKIKINLQIPEIDKFLEDYKKCKKRIEPCKESNKNYNEKKVYPLSVSVGTAASIPDKSGAAQVSSRIYYVKMTMPESLFPTKETKTKSRSEVDEYWKNYAAEKVRKLAESRCPDIAANPETDKNRYADLYKPEVSSYAQAINHPKFNKTPYIWSKMQLFNILSKIDPFFTYKFPHITTIDQSFFSDQAEAFVGLGYLQASELKCADELKSEMR